MEFPKNIKDIEYFSKGKRSLIYTGKYKRKKVTIKIKRQDSLAKDRIRNEAKFLKILNKYKIGPTLIKHSSNYVIYKFVEGDVLLKFLEEKNKIKKKNILIKILKQVRILDKLKINKLEFTRPAKHIFIKGLNVTMIDFERSYYTKKPKNVTQFCQFLIRKKLIKKDIKILKKYKEKQTEKNFKEILKLVK